MRYHEAEDLVETIHNALTAVAAAIVIGSLIIGAAILLA